MSIDPTFIQLSRDLRKNQTPWEKKLWMHLKGRKFYGHKFRRQVVLEPYIYDFCCYEEKLMIELDGAEHTDPDIVKKDKEKSDWARKFGYRMLRFNNTDVQSNIEGVLETIRHKIE